MIEDQMSPERFAQLAPAIQKKILTARAAAERREAKKEDREMLKSWLRYKELEALPVKGRTRAEHNEYQRLRRQQKKLSDKGEPTIRERVGDRVRTAEQFWELNRASVTAKLPAWREQENRVLDQIFWMSKGWACSLQATDFVSLEEGLADMEAFVAEHGLIHDDSSVYQHYELRDFQPSWGVWTLQDTFDPIWRFVPAFFKDSERLSALCSESSATEKYAKYGIRTALNAYAVRMFKLCITNHQHSQLLGCDQHKDNECWLCNFERLHGVTAHRIEVST